MKESSRTLGIERNRPSRKKKTKLGPVQGSDITEASSEALGSSVSEGKAVSGILDMPSQQWEGQTTERLTSKTMDISVSEGDLASAQRIELLV